MSADNEIFHIPQYQERYEMGTRMEVGDFKSACVTYLH